MSATSNIHLIMFPLAAEYRTAAHRIAPWVRSRAQTTQYRKLVALSISCLQSVVNEPNVPVEVVLNAYLQLIQAFIDETLNQTYIEALLNKASTLALRTGHIEFKLTLDSLSISQMRIVNYKAALKISKRCLKDLSVIRLQDPTQFYGTNLHALFYVHSLIHFRMLMDSDYRRAIQFYDDSIMPHINTAAREVAPSEDGHNTVDDVRVYFQVYRALSQIQLGQMNDATQTLLGISPNYSYQAYPQIRMMELMCNLFVGIYNADKANIDIYHEKMVEFITSQQEDCQDSDNWDNWREDGKFTIKTNTLQADSHKNNSSSFLIHKVEFEVKWLSKGAVLVLGNLLSGIAFMVRSPDKKRAGSCFKEGLRVIEYELLSSAETGSVKPKLSFSQLEMRQRYMQLMKCFLLFYACLDSFIHFRWDEIKHDEPTSYLSQLLQLQDAQYLPEHLGELFWPFTLYLSGVYFQATGALSTAQGMFTKIRSVSPRYSEMHTLATLNLFLIIGADSVEPTHEIVRLRQDCLHDIKRGLNNTKNLLRAKAWGIVDLGYSNTSSYRVTKSPSPIKREPNEEPVTDTPPGSGGVTINPKYSELSTQQKIATLLEDMGCVSSSQMRCIMAFICIDRFEADVQLGIARNSVSSCQKYNDPIWSWIMGQTLARLLECEGKTQESQAQSESNTALELKAQTIINKNYKG
ncbi:hypothetical protein NADFUDRAFT_52333 [Nadsonia fulvescens var. elongata DSM 6958]|uniref:Uncharacterized protein n=1 Tax=Nadsonia fulvescens var. elongata DSM 6958 TaxID=857566 RepID=A0A1E3PGZ1_9ASCO|nr:hypothetical protein NADFUDRAFT_52333 [Nadsonia fulvescens var. elongata DSM 6958]